MSNNSDNPNRRQWLLAGAAAGGAALLSARGAHAQDKDNHDHSGHGSHGAHGAKPTPAAKPAPVPPAYRPTAAELGGNTPAVVPNGTTLPWNTVDGVKVFHLVAEPVRHTIAPGLDINAWGYNGRIHGPTIQAVQGDRCRFYVTNKLPEPTTVHWHGILLPAGQDGVGGLNQKAIRPGETHVYEFTLRDAGTFMYHPHADEMTQMALGMVGMIVVHPKRPARTQQRVRDYALMLHEWDVPIGTARPNPLAMDGFNTLTINAAAFPRTEPLVAETGDLVRIRFGNLSAMDHHPIHLHGYNFRVVATDGGPIPRAGQWRETTVLVPTGSCRVIEFVANEPGDWAMHCHMTHHIMNQMGHKIGNLVGVDVSDVEATLREQVPGYMTMGQTGMAGMAEMNMPVPDNSVPMLGGHGPLGYIDMGGMFTIVKVRDKLSGDKDPGWYQYPSGTQSHTATAAELARDGIKLD